MVNGAEPARSGVECAPVCKEKDGVEFVIEKRTMGVSKSVSGRGIEKKLSKNIPWLVNGGDDGNRTGGVMRDCMQYVGDTSGRDGIES